VTWNSITEYAPNPISATARGATFSGPARCRGFAGNERNIFGGEMINTPCPAATIITHNSVRRTAVAVVAVT